MRGGRGCRTCDRLGVGIGSVDKYGGMVDGGGLEVGDFCDVVSVP